jgi:hypothetical protein
MPRPRKYPDKGVIITAYIPRELYEKVRELAKSRGTSISEVVNDLIKKGLEGAGNGVAITVADPPDPPGDAFQEAIKGLEPLERERVLQFMKELDDAEAMLAKLRPNITKKASVSRNTLQDYMRSQEVVELKARVNRLKHTYEKVIKKTVRNSVILNVVGERLLRLMKELGVPA